MLAEQQERRARAHRLQARQAAAAHENRRHARAVARLDRLDAIARGNSDRALQQGVHEVGALELARHRRELAAIGTPTEPGPRPLAELGGDTATMLPLDPTPAEQAAYAAEARDQITAANASEVARALRDP